MKRAKAKSIREIRHRYACRKISLTPDVIARFSYRELAQIRHAAGLISDADRLVALVRASGVRE